MSRRTWRIALIVAAIGGVGALLTWAWIEGQAERRREETRELSIKEAARRFKDPVTGETVVRLDAPTQERLALATQVVEGTKRQRSVRLLGFSIPVPHRIAEIRAPWTGVLEAADSAWPSVGADLRQRHVLGQLLVEWSPAERIQLETQQREIKGVIGETKAEIKVVQGTVERLSKATEIAAAKQLLEAEGRLALLGARLTAAQERETTLTQALSRKDAAVRTRLVVPQDGQLTELHGRPGEVASAGSPIATIYDPRELWVKVQVLPRQLPAGKPPQDAEISFPGFYDKTLSARLVFVNSQSERQQQSLELVYRADNVDPRIPTGLQADVTLRVGEQVDALKVPRSALLQVHERQAIYLQRGSEDFVQRTVEVVDEEADDVYLRRENTIPANALAVVRGAQSLLSEEYKESIQLIEEGKEKQPRE